MPNSEDLGSAEKNGPGAGSGAAPIGGCAAAGGDDPIGRLRGRIDDLDAQVLKLLNERAALAREIGRLKGQGAKYRPDREAAVLDKTRARNTGPLSDEAAMRLQREVMSACLALEKPLTIAFLGPEGTFSHMAALKHFGSSALMAPKRSAKEALRAVETGECDMALIPVENSSSGSVGQHLDLLIDTPLAVTGEAQLRVRFHLMSKTGDALAVRTVTAHPQALAQCKGFLDERFGSAALLPAPSNAEAAKSAALCADGSVAALASDLAAEIYGLRVAARDVEDEANNTTRFLALGGAAPGPTGNDKTSLALSAPNKAGAMSRLLEPLSRHRVSMTKLESRPSRSGMWEYVFFVDVVGHREDPPLAAALEEISEVCPFVKVLGSYPAARM